ncbi:MAG TPA: hypothetical protein VFN97_18865 [Actinospica sp.]|nr:hypothetical protein [Actinospica sp.]
MSGRRVLGAALAALVLGGTAACGTTMQVFTTPQTTAATAKATATSPAAAAEKNAIFELQGWLADPQPGTLTYNTIQVTSGGAINVMTILSGPFDPAGTATLTGSIATLGSGSTTQGASSALEYGQKVYTSIPATLQTGSRAGKLWELAPVRSTWTAGERLSGWWTALNSVKQVQSDGVASLDGATVDMFSAFIDLSTVKNIPKALLSSDPVDKAGTTKVEVDVYTAMGSGRLVRVTYKFGLPVQIDASEQNGMTAGYEVDLSGFNTATATASPTPTGTASVPPAPASVASGPGDTDLAALLPF